MSVPAIALTAIQGLGLVALQALFGSSTFRSIGPLEADVTVEEEHHDEMYITQHPVEMGAAISDHAFKQPARVHIRVGWSPASQASTGNSLVDSALAIIPSVGDPSYLTDIYANLLLLQESAALLNVFTGKRAYTNMLIRSLSVKTDQQTENALLVDVDLQQIIIAQTQTVSLTNASVQQSPSQTAAPANNGTQQSQQVPDNQAPTAQDFQNIQNNMNAPVTPQTPEQAAAAVANAQVPTTTAGLNNATQPYAAPAGLQAA